MDYENDYDDDNNDRILQIIPSEQLRLIPLHIVITHIYDKIIEKASVCELFYNFNIDKIIKNYGINESFITSNNKKYIINEIKRLFPGIKITEIKENTSCSLYNSYLNASWKEECDEDIEIIDETNILNNETGSEEDLETYNDMLLKQAIQASLKESKKPSIMGEKAEERIKKSQEKYKKLYK